MMMRSLSSFAVLLMLAVAAALQGAEEPQATFDAFCADCFRDFRSYMVKHVDRNAGDNGELVGRISDSVTLREYLITYGQVAPGNDQGNGTAHFSPGFRIRFVLNAKIPYAIGAVPSGMKFGDGSEILFQLPHLPEEGKGGEIVLAMKAIICFNAGKHGFPSPWADVRK